MKKYSFDQTSPLKDILDAASIEGLDIENKSLSEIVKELNNIEVYQEASFRVNITTTDGVVVTCGANSLVSRDLVGKQVREINRLREILNFQEGAVIFLNGFTVPAGSEIILKAGDTVDITTVVGSKG